MTYLVDYNIRNPNLLSDILGNVPSGKQLRIHGNGFLQVPQMSKKGDDVVRAHAWSPIFEVLPQHNAYIHDHVWPFTSDTRAGRVPTTIYNVQEEGHIKDFNGPKYEIGLPFDMYSVGEADKPGMGGFIDRVYRTTVVRMTMTEGSTYHFSPGMFHESDPHSLGLTVITKGAFDANSRPRVLCPVGAKPMDAFAFDQPSQNDLTHMLASVIDQLRANTIRRDNANVGNQIEVEEAA